MKITGNFIVKDDSEITQLQNAVLSVVPYVDGIYITANGEETDKIESWCHSNNLHYSYLKWDKDFSAQRNFNFDTVPDDTDFIFWMDSDDILVGGEYLRDIARKAKDKNLDQVFLTYWYGCTFTDPDNPTYSNLKNVDLEHQRERLIKPGTHKWKGRLHETPVPLNGKRDSYSKYSYHPEKRPIAIMHTTTHDIASVKMNRNRRILEQQLEEERQAGEADPRTLLYLMKIYAESDSKETLRECISMGEEYMQKSGWDEERATCADLMAVCYNKMDDYHKTIDLLHEAIKEYPHQPIHYIRLALAYYNVDKFREARHWMDLGAALPMDDKTAGVNNIQEMKILFAQLALKLKFNVDKDIPAAVEAARMLNEFQPEPEHEENLLFLMDLNDLNNASKNADELLKYLESIGEEKAVLPILKALPQAITGQPFAQDYIKRYQMPRKWEDNEICYFANFGGKHFEQWSPKSLEKGLGGSETAVIELSRQWAKKGYKVTVYGDPMEDKGTYEGVEYLPWYYFNAKDDFNIFIQWRDSSLAGKVKAKKFLVDMHDMYFWGDHEDNAQRLDKFMVKSDFHKSLRGEIEENKFEVVGNGIKTS